MKKIKKLLVKSICLLLVTITTFSLCGCAAFEPKKFVAGDFIVQYKLRDTENDPNSYLCVLGLSKAGQKKKTIILPKKINGHPYLLKYKIQGSLGWGDSETDFKGEMEKFYLEYPGDYSQKEKYKPRLNLLGCSKMKKVFLNAYAGASSDEEVLHYYNYIYYDYILNNDGILDSNILDNNYILETTDEEKVTITGKEKLIVDKKVRLANLQYMYNFEGAENYGYYWIDDIDNGETVEIIPDIPERDGYTFGGWYTEKECINEFDFNTVFNKPVLVAGETYPEDYVTYLYAKWIPNEE